MSYIKTWMEAHGLNFELILTLTIVLVVAALIVLVILKLFKVAIGLGFLFIVVPLLFSLFFGDGGALVQQASDYLPDDVGNQLEESYDYFKQKEAEDPLFSQTEAEP